MQSIVILTRCLPHNYRRISHLIARGIPPAHVVFEGPMKDGGRVKLLGLAESLFLWLEHMLFFRGHPPVNDLFYRRYGSMRAMLDANKIPWSSVANHNDPEVEQLLRGIAPDYLILFGTRIIKPHILAIPKQGTLNTHSAMLPKCRGTQTEFWILYRNKPEQAGVTVHWVEPALDAGAICLQEHTSVLPDETTKTLRAKSHFLSPMLLAETLRRMAAGETLRFPQNEAEATKCTKPTPEDRAAFARGERHE